jgi:phosphate transport system substrate-binding protein
MTKALSLLLVTAIVTTFAVNAGAEETIVVCGGQATMSTFFIPSQETFEDESGINVEIRTSSTIQGVLDVNAGNCDLSGGTTPLLKIKENAAIKGRGIDLSSFRERSLGNMAILAFTHRDNSVKALSKEQLKGIFTGKITNWKAVGGEDREIIVVWGNTPGQNALFRDAIMDNEPVLDNHVKVADYKEIRQNVAAMPGAIGINGEGFTNSTINVPTIPPVREAAFAYTKGEPSPKVQKLLKYIDEMERIFR